MGPSIIYYARFVCLLILFNLIYGCTGYKPAYLKVKDAAGKRIYKSREAFFKEYALCSCLLQSITRDSLNDASKSTYYDLSDDDLMIGNVGNKIDSLVRSYLNRSGKVSGETYENRKAPTYECIVFYKSTELDIIISDLVRSLKKNNK